MSIVKVKGGYVNKTKHGKGKALGKPRSHAAAVKQLQAIEYFKNRGK